MLLFLVRLPCGDQPHDRLTLSEAVTNDQNPRLEAQAKQNESVFIIGVVRVKELDRVLILEDGARVFEGCTVLLDIGPVLLAVPFERQLRHTYSVHIETRVVHSCMLETRPICHDGDPLGRRIRRATDVALGHSRIRRNAGFAVGGIAVEQDRGNVFGAVPVLEARIGWRQRLKPSLRTRPLAIDANASTPRQPGSRVPPLRRPASGAEFLPGMEAGLFLGPLFWPLFFYLDCCIVAASRTAATG
jgi:hypothetical protein